VPAAPDTPSAQTPWTRHLSSDVIARLIGRAVVLRALHPVVETGSTQDVALSLTRDGAASGTVVIADAQRSGRGRQGRRWDDAPGGGTLAMTLLLDTPEAAVGIVPHAVGLAVGEMAARMTGADVVLKWPNDVIVRAPASRDGVATSPARKLAGILVQREDVAGRDVLLIGVGLNVDLRGMPAHEDRVCLSTLLGAGWSGGGSASPPIEREDVLVELLGALDARIAQLLEAPMALLDDYRERSDTLGRQVGIDLQDERRMTGTVVAIDDEGRLVVDVDGREEVVISGTIRDHDHDGARPTEEAR
jgi:BirA family biotin operon repressor/biotin-[acetyl-CoA-carboxylase] ligase